MTQNTLPQSQNEAWGFFNTISHHAEPRQAWNLAITKVAEAIDEPLETARAFLDSRMGRHFADSVSNHLTDCESDNGAAIDAAITEWMGWKIGHRTSRDTGIPLGLPHLVGFAIDAWIQHEASDA